MSKISYIHGKTVTDFAVVITIYQEGGLGLGFFILLLNCFYPINSSGCVQLVVQCSCAFVLYTLPVSNTLHVPQFQYIKSYEDSVRSGSEDHLSTALLMVTLDSATNLPVSVSVVTCPMVSYHAHPPARL